MFTHPDFPFCTGGATRTPDTWFWRPVLYQRSYTRKPYLLKNRTWDFRVLFFVSTNVVIQQFQLPVRHQLYGHLRGWRSADPG